VSWLEDDVKKPKCLERIHHADVLVCTAPRCRSEYGAAFVRLYSRHHYDGDRHRDELELEVEYQRNVLTGDESRDGTLYESSMPDPRLDVGTPMTSCYAAHLDRVEYLHESRMRWLADVLRVTQKAEWTLPVKAECDCARMADALASLGVPVEFKYLHQSGIYERCELAPFKLAQGDGAEIVRLAVARRLVREADERASRSSQAA
jgi:hypothetical protein